MRLGLPVGRARNPSPIPVLLTRPVVFGIAGVRAARSVVPKATEGRLVVGVRAAEICLFKKKIFNSIFYDLNKVSFSFLRQRHRFHFKNYKVEKVGKQTDRNEDKERHFLPNLCSGFQARTQWVCQ